VVMRILRHPHHPRLWVELHLVKPSNYDDDGYVVTHFRGVLPSNTLNCLAALTQDVIAQKSLREDVALRMFLYDETVQHLSPKQICRSAGKKNHRVIVCLVGVQTNQFPRACDLARQFRALGATVLMGGFHVSGYLSMIPEIPEDMRTLMEEGITLVKGEVEETWGAILADAVHGRLKPLYDFVNDKPDLFTKPIPLLDRRLMKRFMASNFGTIDCGRGCPFNCSFCTIINVQGHKMRVRSAAAIADAIRLNWQRNHVDFYFFTDDNFARNSQWEAIFDTLIRLREEEKIDVKFMMQVDVLSYKIPRFVDKARRAGCTQVFIGMESINPANLKKAAKNQNKSEDYVHLIRAWHDASVATHVGYILGFPYDTAESIRQDLQRLIHEIQVEQASFFILTPLPGSRDHLEMVRQNAYMDPDYNKYDSIHETVKHPNFPEGGSLKALYYEAWETFYGFENMKRILSQAAPRTYWNIFKNFIWYKNAALLERRHPMMAGFYRRKNRAAMRRGAVVPGLWTFWKMRARESLTYAKGMIRLLWEMQELWLQTRPRNDAEERLVQEMRRIYQAVHRRLTVSELQLAYQRARTHLPELKVPSRLTLYWQKWNLFYANRRVFTRQDIDATWLRFADRVRRYRFPVLPPIRFLANLWLDVQVWILFAAAFLRSREPIGGSRSALPGI
jgi:radical SAM superfamily enzyme YgiQ (UPF0313 family)